MTKTTAGRATRWSSSRRRCGWWRAARALRRRPGRWGWWSRRCSTGSRLSAQGKLTGADSKPVSAEQMEISRLRAELARVKMERDILGKATAYFAKERGEVRLHRNVIGACGRSRCSAGCWGSAWPATTSIRTPGQRMPQRRHLSDEALLVHIKAIHAETRGELRLAADLEGTAGARHPGGQGPGAKAHAAARHPGQGQAHASRSRPTATTTCRSRPTCSIGSSRWPSPTGSGRATSPTSPPTKAGCSWPW